MTMKFLNKLFLSVVALIILSMSVLVWAYENGQLVLDMRNVPVLPKHFRTSSDPLTSTVNTNGLANLHMAGGAQFSKLALDKILERLASKHVTIIDLREESHGFLNGNAISWYAPADAANAGMTESQIERTQARL